jgi:probable rRNA maturation factor
MTTQNNREPLPRAKSVLDIELVEDAGDWSMLADAERVVQEAADAIAAWPGLVCGAATVSIALSSDAEIAALNSQFRGQPKPTNVLSFPAGHGAELGFLGDIILAAETVTREAVDQETSLTHHVQHLIVHGVLHLMGFDHETGPDAERMEALEISILAELGIANPYTGELDTAKKE